MLLPKLSNDVYDFLKWLALILLPALGALYFALAGIWGFPYAEQIVGTLTVIDTFLGVLLGISNIQYKTNMPINAYGTAPDPCAKDLEDTILQYALREQRQEKVISDAVNNK